MEAIDSLFNTNPPLLAQAPEETEEEITIEPNPDNPETPIEDTAESENAPEPSSNTDELDQKPYKELQQIAKQHGINPRQPKRTLAGLIRELLAG